MPIRQRDFSHLPEEGEDSGNVTEQPVRDTFDPRKDPFPGSELEPYGEDAHEAMPVQRFIGWDEGMKHQTPLPVDTPIQTLLARVRTPYNKHESVEERYRKRIKSPLSAIRAFCVECEGFSPKAVGKCASVRCPLWPFRLGTNGMRQ